MLKIVGFFQPEVDNYDSIEDLVYLGGGDMGPLAGKGGLPGSMPTRVAAS